MIKRIIRKIISVILITSMLITNICSVCNVRDFKLSIIYMIDAIEDMEYKERESSYREEHLSILTSDENKDNIVNKNTESTSVENSEQQSSSSNDESIYISGNEEDITTNENAEEPETDKLIESSWQDESETNETVGKEETTTIINNKILTNENIEDEKSENIAKGSDAEESGEDSEEQENYVETTTNQSDGNMDIATKSEIEDVEITDIEFEISTPSEISEENYGIELDIATESEIAVINSWELNNFSNGLFGYSSGQELFTMPESSSDFVLRAVTKKSRRGGQTYSGVLEYGIM